MSRPYLRGDMYYTDLGQGIGSEQAGYRPVVIIQNNTGNKHSPTVIVAAISSKAGVKPKLPTHYFINAECGLKLPSIVLMEQIRTLDKQRLTKYIGRLSSKHFQGLHHALAVSVGLSKPIPGKLTLCLCGACADAFRGTGAFALQEVTHGQAEKEVCAYCKQEAGGTVRRAAQSGEGEHMKKILSAPMSEHTVNNVKYEVVSSFKESRAGDGAEDLSDKMKRLILTENIKPKKK